MTSDQKRVALIEQYHRLKERVEQTLQRCRRGEESIGNATLAVLDFGNFTLKATKELMGDGCERN